MNKEEYIWVALRIFGLFLIVMAILAIPDAIAVFYQSSIFYSFSVGELSEAANDSEKLGMKIFEAQRIKSISSLLKVIIYGLFGVYFLRGGRAIHKLISYE